MRFHPALAVATVAGVMALSPGAGAGSPAGSTLVELEPSARCSEAAFLIESGGRLVVESLGLYEIPNASASSVVGELRSRGALRLVTRNRPLGRLSVQDLSDPLVGSEWWRAAVGVDTLTPPGPGKPVTIVDAGVDVNHPEFLGRADTVMMNAQEPAPIGGNHGTKVASVVGAPVNGVGLVGIYPQAVLRSWDAAKGQGIELETVQIVEGIIAAANAGPGIINLSIGGDKDELIEQAVYEAVRKGSLVVAAAGNDGDRGNELGYPASVPHVLTVAASDRNNAIADFSSRSRFVDLAAPGVEISVATVFNDETRQVDETWDLGNSGTSFATPLVSGASAWVWTVRPDLDATQLFEVMRRSAIDIGPPGRDDSSGFGLLNVPAALAFPAPVRDPLEPNDDVEFVRPEGFFDSGIPSLTTPARQRASLTARLDQVEDQRDVYRVWLRKNGSLTVAATADGNLDLGLWKPGTASVAQRVLGNDRLARAATASSKSKRLTFSNRGPGRYAYLAVTLPKGVSRATYNLRVS